MDSPSPKLTLAVAVQHRVLASVALCPFCMFSSVAGKLTLRMVSFGNIYQMHKKLNKVLPGHTKDQ